MNCSIQSTNQSINRSIIRTYTQSTIDREIKPINQSIVRMMQYRKITRSMHPAGLFDDSSVSGDFIFINLNTIPWFCAFFLGGSPYLAAKVNEAKDVMESRTRL